MAGQKQIAPANNIEESYPLSPMQQGMLFHSLGAPHSGVDIEQVIVTLKEEMDDAAFRRAWERVVERHAILRTAFRLAGVEPQQEVHRCVRLHLEQMDWRGLPDREQEKRLDAYLQAERRRGFELGVPPLMRMALLHAGEAKHIFAWTFHHLLIDGRTLVALLNEVFKFYEAFCRGGDLALPLPRPYREYIEWLRERDGSAAETFWRKLLKGFVTPTPLIVSRSADPAANPNTGHRVQQVTLSTAESARVRAVARENGLTVSTLLQGVWAVLLSRYSGEEDIVFGVIRACRRSALEGAESIVGLFINTLPVRVRVADDKGVLDWLKELRAQNLALRDHEHTPLAEIQRWSDVPPGQPLFESIFNFQDPSWDAALRAQSGPWEQREFAIRNQPNFPLWVDVYAGPEMTLKIGYDPERFADPTIARALGHFQAVLQGTLADLSQRVADLSLLTDGERRQLLVEWNRTGADDPLDSCVHELFEAQVERTSDAVALVYCKEEVSYRELDNQANRMARHLRSLGVGPDVPVGICVRRTAEMIVGLLGILKAGGAYLPLDPAYPRERLAFMLEDSGAPVLLSEESVQNCFRFQIQNGHVVCFDALRREPRRAPQETAARSALPSPPAGVSPDNLAYLIYTSGSTGTPKGVELSHRGLVNLIRWHQRTYNVGPKDRATQLAGFSFDASVWELWPYLTAGASIHLVDDETRASAPALVQWLDDRKITLAFVPTPLAEEMLALPWPAGAPLRALLTGGDKLRRRPDANLPFRLVNHYGPTENTVVATAATVAPAQEGLNEAPPIGRPIANVRAYVLDRLLRAVPVGVPGELYIGGDGLARGYRNNPGLTATRFIPHPHSEQPGARLYKTGDLVRWLEDGNLEFLGRVDHQVKIRGYRIEPGEIESQLNRHPAVRESLVLAHEDARGEKQLVAHLVLRQQPAPASKELSDFLRTTLPDYMVPSAFVFLDAWPLTPNGKVDRQALPAPKELLRRSSRAFVAPRNPLEAAVATIWAEVLGRSRIGVHENFFEQGGHSLRAAQVVSRLKEALNIDLSVRSLFEKPTVAALAREIERATASRAAQRGPSLTRVSREAYRMNPPSSETAAQAMRPE